MHLMLISCSERRREKKREAKLEKAFYAALDCPDAFTSYEDERAALVGCKPSRRRTDSETQQVQRIIESFLRYERDEVFGNLPGEAVPGPKTLDMGGQFLTNKRCIEEQSLIFDAFAKPVPKGCLLHLHFNTGRQVADLLLKARKNQHLYIRSERALIEKEDFDETELVFNTLDPEKVEDWVDVFSRKYKPEGTTWKGSGNGFKGWMLWKQFRRSFKSRSSVYESYENFNCEDTSGNALDPAERWVWSKMVLQENEVYGAGQTVNGQVIRRAKCEPDSLT